MVIIISFNRGKKHTIALERILYFNDIATNFRNNDNIFEYFTINRRIIIINSVFEGVGFRFEKSYDRHTDTTQLRNKFSLK